MKVELAILALKWPTGFQTKVRGNTAIAVAMSSLTGIAASGYAVRRLLRNNTYATFKSRPFIAALCSPSNKSSSTGLRGLFSSARRFRTDRNGASAVEFAIVAAPFFAILLGTLELALIFIVNTGLSIATEAFATQVRTGQVQAPGLAVTVSSGIQLDLNDTKTQLCNQVQIVSFSSCMKQLQIDVRPLTSFQNTSSTSPISGSTFNSANPCFYSGNAGDVVEMRAYYLYPLIDPLLSYAFSSVKNYISSNGTFSGLYYPIQATQVFKSETYSGQTNSGAGC